MRSEAKSVLGGRKFLGILILMIFICGLAIAQDVAEKGKPAPNFTLEDVNGNKVSLSDLKGKVVFLNFWAMSCHYCKVEMPSMELLYQKFKNDGLVVVTVNLIDSQKTLKEFVKKTGYTFLILRDENREARNKYPTAGIPYSVIIDRSGVVRELKLGAENWMDEDLLSYFEKLLKEGT